MTVKHVGLCHPDNECWPECSAMEAQILQGENMARVSPGEAVLALTESEAPWARLSDPGTRHAAPRPTAPPLPIVTPPTHNLPDGVHSVMWIPLQQSDGTTVFQTTVDGFGYRATASSRSKMKALAYALEDIAEQILANAI